MKSTLLCSAAAVLLLTACNKNSTENKNNADSLTTTTSTELKPGDSAVVDMHNAENSLDFEGTYEGTVLSGSVSMKTNLTINEDKTFELKEEIVNSQDKGAMTSKGKWVINENTLTLNFDNVADRVLQYHVGENQLTQLDAKGNRPAGPDASKFELKKIK